MLGIFVATLCSLAVALFNLHRVRELACLAIALVTSTCLCDMVYLLWSTHSGLIEASVWQDMRKYYNERGLMDAKMDTPLADFDSGFWTTFEQGQASELTQELKRAQLGRFAFDLVGVLLSLCAPQPKPDTCASEGRVAWKDRHHNRSPSLCLWLSLRAIEAQLSNQPHAGSTPAD